MKLAEIFQRELSQNVDTHLLLTNLIPEINKAIKKAESEFDKRYASEINIDKAINTERDLYLQTELAQQVQSMR